MTWINFSNWKPNELQKSLKSWFMKYIEKQNFTSVVFSNISLPYSLQNKNLYAYQGKYIKFFLQCMQPNFWLIGQVYPMLMSSVPMQGAHSQKKFPF